MPKLFKALGNRVVILPDERDEVTAGGIVLPTDAQKYKITGTVLGVGPDVPHSIQEGDRVTYPQYAGVEIRIEDAIFLVMEYTKLVGILTETQKVSSNLPTYQEQVESVTNLLPGE